MIWLHTDELVHEYKDVLFDGTFRLSSHNYAAKSAAWQTRGEMLYLWWSNILQRNIKKT